MNDTIALFKELLENTFRLSGDFLGGGASFAISVWFQ